MRRCVLLPFSLSVVACGSPSPQAQATAALEAALTTRDPDTVSEAARAAGEWEGQDPHLDKLLGDALANVLMRPGAGLELLKTRRDPADPMWVAAVAGAAARIGETNVVQAVSDDAGLGLPPVPADALAWLRTQALSDPAIGQDTLEWVAHTCALLDAQPLRGRRTVDQPATDKLPALLPVLGADLVVLGRSTAPADPPPETGRGRLPCRTGRAYVDSTVWPEPLPGHVVVGIRTGEAALHFSVKPEAGAPWVFGSTQPEATSELVAHTTAIAEGKATPDPAWLPERMKAPPR